MLITPKQNTLASSALRRPKEDNFLYRIVRLEDKIELKTEWKMFPEYRPQHFQ